MVVGVAVIELRVHDSQSLKAKRGVVRAITGRVRNRFNVSVSEVGGQGTWQRAVLGLSMAGSAEPPVRRALEKVVDFVEQTHLAELTGSEIETLHLPLVGLGVDDPGGLDDGSDLPWSTGLADPGGATAAGASAATRVSDARLEEE